MDVTSYDYSIVYTAVFEPLVTKAVQLIGIAVMVLLAMLLYCGLKYRINPFGMTEGKLRGLRIRFKPFDFARWLIVDALERKRKGENFEEYGFTVYCGRQGAGKSVSMVEYLLRMHRRFPKSLIVTNFQFKYATHRMNDWKDLMEIRNGMDGVIFAIDEIHSEYSNAAWKDFPEELLSEISQQRKQRVKIVATSQVYSRIVKQIREQCASVVQCKTWAGRWTHCREYDAVEYEQYSASGKKDEKLRSYRRWSFVQSPGLRNSFDTYEKIERMRKMEFLPRNER